MSEDIHLSLPGGCTSGTWVVPLGHHFGRHSCDVVHTAFFYFQKSQIWIYQSIKPSFTSQMSSFIVPLLIFIYLKCCSPAISWWQLLLLSISLHFSAHCRRHVVIWLSYTKKWPPIYKIYETSPPKQNPLFVSGYHSWRGVSRATMEGGPLFASGSHSWRGVSSWNTPL